LLFRTYVGNACRHRREDSCRIDPAPLGHVAGGAFMAGSGILKDGCRVRTLWLPEPLTEERCQRLFPRLPSNMSSGWS
jgi:hypothetical protein